MFVSGRGGESLAGRQAPRVMALLMDRGYFVHQSTLERIERKGARDGEKEGGSAAGHLIVIVSPGSCGSAHALFSFFCVPSSVPPSSAVISSSTAENAIDMRLERAQPTPLCCAGGSKTPIALCPASLCLSNMLCATYPSKPFIITLK